MLKSKTTLILLFMITCHLYPQESFDDLFNSNELTAEEEQVNPFRVSGDHEFTYSFPYIETSRFKPPVFNNTFSLTCTADNVNILSRWKIDVPEGTIIPDENYIRMSFDNTVIKTGYSLFSWGSADELNPTDKLCSRDYRNPLEITKIPALSISAEQYCGSTSIELVYIPVKEASLFPYEAAEIIPGTLINPDHVAVEEKKLIENFVLGGKINYYGPVDFSISYIYNVDDFYIPEVKVNPDYPVSGQPLDRLLLKNQRIEQIGLCGKAIAGNLGVWLELNYSNAEISKDYFEWTGGLDFSFGKQDEGYINAQSFGKWCPEYEKPPGFDNMSDYTNPADFYFDILTPSLQNIETELLLGITAKISYKLMEEEFTPEVICVYTTTPEGKGTLIVKPKTSWKPKDSLSIDLGMNIVYQLDDNEMYRELHKNDNVYLSIQYHW